MLCSGCLDYADHMLPFKLLFRDIIKNEMPNEEIKFIKNKLKNFAITSFQSNNYNNEIHLSKNKQLALNNFSNNKNIVTLKSDNSNHVISLDKYKYLERMPKILNKPQC